jgi:hypothetical protein
MSESDPARTSAPDDEPPPVKAGDDAYAVPNHQPVLIGGMILMVIGALIAAPMGLCTVFGIVGGVAAGGREAPAVIAAFLLPTLAGASLFWAGLRMWRGAGPGGSFVLVAVALGFLLLGLKACDSALRF